MKVTIISTYFIICLGHIDIVIQKSLWSIGNLIKQYEVSLSWILNSEVWRPPQFRRDSGLDSVSGDPGSIPGTPSTRVGPLMAKRLKTSSDVTVLVSR